MCYVVAVILCRRKHHGRTRIIGKSKKWTDGRCVISLVGYIHRFDNELLLKFLISPGQFLSSAPVTFPCKVTFP